MITRIIIEWPYYDRDYLSTYYIHYSKKFKNYPKYCYRIHFINKNQEYCGFIILRPIIFGKKIGETYICPEILLKENAYLMTANYKVHINGNTYTINAFPWMMQETDISICAHIATWTILRYYANNYTSPTLGDIVEKVSEEWGRKTPSIGLTPIQVSQILSQYKFYPIIRGGYKEKQTQLLDETIAYIESGIPVIAMSESRQHAFSIIGHEQIKKDILDDEEYVNKLREPTTNIILHSKLINSLYVMDDNLFPYRKIDKYTDSKSDATYGIYEISYVIIPLYSRMQLEYHEVYSRYLGLVKYSDMKWKNNRIVRIYLTSSNYLKDYARNHIVSKELKNIIIHLNMSKFVWCVDSSSFEEYKKGMVSGKVIIDSTAGTKETEPWILMHDNEKIKYYDVSEDSKHILKVEIPAYKEYAYNLNFKKSYHKES